jgi:hypothetical protein
MGQRVTTASEVKSERDGAAAKASLKGREFVVVDPKPGDLSMARVKFW